MANKNFAKNECHAIAEQLWHKAEADVTTHIAACSKLNKIQRNCKCEHSDDDDVDSVLDHSRKPCYPLCVCESEISY